MIFSLVTHKWESRASGYGVGDTFYDARGLTNNISISEGRMRIVNKVVDSKLKEQIPLFFLQRKIKSTWLSSIAIAQFESDPLDSLIVLNKRSVSEANKVLSENYINSQASHYFFLCTRGQIGFACPNP